MIHLLISIIGILGTILFVIGTHESAHFAAARLLGIKVLRFSIGFGKVLWRWKDKKGTEYVFALVPLGGYVKMLDENEENVAPAELHQAFNRQPYYKKFIVVIAGPLCNLFCALFLYWIIFTVGFTTIKPVIGNVAPNSIAADAGLKTNDEILSLDNQSTLSWTNIVFRLMLHAGSQDQLKINTENLKTKKLNSHLLDLTDWKMDELKPDPLGSLGITPYEPPIPLIIGAIAPESPASKSDLKVGDKMLAVNQQSIPNWRDLLTFIQQHPDQKVTLTIERENKKIQIPLNIGYQRDFLFQKVGYLGIGPDFKWPAEFLREVKYGPIDAVARSYQEVRDFTYFNFILFGKMITGKISLQSLGGPITIFETAGNALNYGFFAFMAFLAFLSVSIGVINLLPIPGLDGGHLFLYTIELIIRRPIPPKTLFFLFKLGFLLIFFVLLQALINDVLRLY